METLYKNHDDLRVYQFGNYLMSLQPSNFETLNDFFTKFKHTILLLKQCKVEKADYLVFVCTFRAGKLIALGWKIPTLNVFIESLTCEHDKLVQMGIIRSSHDQALHVSRPKYLKGKGKQ